MIYGWRNYRGYNPHFFLQLRPVSGDNSVKLPASMKHTVVGRVISDDESNNVNWGSILENSSIENSSPALTRATALLQSGEINELTGEAYGIGKTTVTTFEVLQKFNGIEPQTLNYTLEFVATTDTYKEVDGAYNFLKKMLRPQLKKGIAYSLATRDDFELSAKWALSNLGHAPFLVKIVRGDKSYLNTRFILENVGSSRDELKIDKNGYNIRREVSITLKSLKAVMRDDIRV